MSIDVETKDCTALTDDELAEMAGLCAEGPHPYEVGLLTKHAESWVLITMARDGVRLKGFSFSTLERIGGTPSVIVGLASIQRSSKRDTVLRAMIHDQLRRSVLAFPDEDVLFGTCLASPSGFDAFRTLSDVVPRPDYVATGEERAWGRRLAKRFGIDAASYDDRGFTAKGAEVPPCVLSHDSLKPEKLPDGVEGLFGGVEPASGDVLLAFGWALAEDLEKFA